MRKWHYHSEKDVLSPNYNYISRVDLFEHLIPRFAMQDNIMQFMRKDTVTQIREQSILMDALKRCEIGYFSEFYKRNHRKIIVRCRIVIVLWAIGTALLFICYEGKLVLDYYFHNTLNPQLSLRA